MSAVDDGGQGKHCPVCIQNDWIDDRVLDDGKELFQFGIIVQVVLQNSKRRFFPAVRIWAIKMWQLSSAPAA